MPSDSRKAEGRHRGRRSSPSSRRALVVNQESASWLRRGFPWIYPKEILHRPAKLKPGRELQVESEQGQFLGRVIWEGDWIAARCMRREQGALDSGWLRERLESARRYREEILPPETTAWRWIHAENDGLPGIRVDVYGWYLVVTLDGPAFLPLMERMLPLLQELSEARGIYLAWRLDPRSQRSPDSLPREPGLIAGSPPPGDVRVLERGVPCLVRPQSSKDIGIFPDMRDNRAWLEPHWGGSRVLNLFCHTGFFSVCAAVGGASTTASVDLSGVFLSRAEANFVAAGLDPAAHDFIQQDARKALDRYRRLGERFDKVILDPPSFSHSSDGRWALEKDYPGIVSRCLRVLEPGGWLIAASNHGALSPRAFHGLVRDGAWKAKASLQLIHEGSAAPDFPARVDFPEARFLKFGVWRRE